MKKSIVTLVAMALALGACAESVSPEMAKAAANAWVLRNGKFDAGRSASGKVITVRDTNQAGTVLWYQVSMTGDGCVIVAPVTEIEPVVVALDNDPGELPAAHPLRGILTGDMRKRLRFLGLYPEDAGASLQSIAPKPAATAESAAVAAEWASQQQAKWARLGIGGGAKLQAEESVGRDAVDMEVCVVKGFERGGPLTHWNQGSNGGLCYNYYTPGNVVCGCVATACAAMVQFFGATNGVKNVQGDCSYEGQYYSCRTMGGEYNWNLFTNCTRRADYNRLSKEQRELLGRVAYDAGVGVEMSWSSGGSGAVEAKIASTLKNVFGFKYARYVGLNGDNPGEMNLRKLIYGQNAAGAPVGMAIEGHSVVAVGYGQDGDGVERVRVFMGWGGSGDGWYALPYIDTKAVAGGSTYLSTVVDGVVTMISYSNSDIVPVVGQATAPGFAVVFDDVLSWQEFIEEQEEVDPETGVVTTNQVIVKKLKPRVIETDENGWFATRVPPTPGDKKFTIAGKNGGYTIGSAAASATQAARLTPALPDWIVPFPLLNSTVAFSFDQAVELALAENKAILRVSGTGSDTNTMSALNYIYALDDQNVNDFTNRFVYFFSSFASTNGDMRPSYSVYLPQASQADERWYFTNGRLSYGYGRQQATTNLVSVTNITTEIKLEDVEVTNITFEAEIAITNIDTVTVTNFISSTNIVEAFSTNAVISTYAPTGGTPQYEIWPSWPTFSPEAETAYQTSIDAVLAAGWEQYLKKSSDISVTVESSVSPESGTPSPNWGTNTDCYQVGDEILVTGPGEETTNTTAGVVMGCTGYTLICRNDLTGQAYQHTGTEMSFTLPAAEKGDHFTVIWETGVKAVHIGVAVTNGKGTYEPAEGWFPVGEPVVFTATPEPGYVVERWNGAGAAFPEGSILGGPGCPSVYVMPTAKTELNLRFTAIGMPAWNKRGENGTNYTITVDSYLLPTDENGEFMGFFEIDDPEFAAITLSGEEAINGMVLSNGCTYAVTNLNMGMLVMPTVVDKWGTKWTCKYWNLYDPELGEGPAHEAGEIYEAAVEDELALDCGTGPFWGYKPSQDGKLVLYWFPEDAEDPEEPVEVEVPINWNDSLNNLHSGQYVVLSAEKAKELPAGSTVTVGEPPLGWKLDGEVHTAPDGSLVVDLVLDEAVLQPKDFDGGEHALTIIPNSDGTVTVKADISNGVRGFWYSLYTSDELVGPWGAVWSGYEEGTPIRQATSKNSSGVITLSIVVRPEEAKRFYKLVVSEKQPSTK